MQIQSNIAFRARVNMEKLTEVPATLSTLSYGSGVIGATSIGATASKVIGSASNVAAAASFAQASGVDSFGMVPSMLDKAASTATPQTITSAENNPSTMGTLLSIAGSWFNDLFKVKVKTPKDPS